MKCAMIQFDTRDDHEFDELVSQNLQYCVAAGYDHKMFGGNDLDIPPYWAKVAVCDAVAESGEYDAILFVDTDAVVMDFGFRIEDVLSSHSMAVSGANGSANAGVFAIRCGDTGRSILKDWMSRYSRDDWDRTQSNEWSCKTCGWAGAAYEQGSLNDLVIPKFRESVVDVGWESFLHCDHLRERPNELYVPDFQRFVIAMRTAKVVHFCRAYKVLVPVRHKARLGLIALFDERSPNAEEAMKEAKRICLEGQM
jgi:predicted RNA-binding Zn-ribbon protein involved in translation (DUF1610 family)